MIKSVEIMNYKVIDSLKIENLSNINFFVGKNNCGKTSLLEAIYLNFYPSNPEYIINVVSNAIRQIRLNNNNLSYFFHKMNPEKPIEIISMYNDKKMMLKIRPNILNDFTQNIPTDTSINKTFESNKLDRIDGLIFEVKFNDREKVKSSFNLNGENIINMRHTQYQHFNGILMASNTMLMNLTFIVGQISILKKGKILNEYLKIFDNNILGVEVIGNEVMIDIEGMPKKIGINIMGEGFKKYLFIVGNLILNKYDYFCIDEIENGLHFETMIKLIDSIIELTKVANIQLFISTHSYEFLEILNVMSLEKKYHNIAVFNIDRTKTKGLQAYRYNMDDLKHLLETKTEFRE